MLVLTRKIGERVAIGVDTWVTVVGVVGNRVRLGLDAPKQVTILRQEILDRETTSEGDREAA